MTDIETIFHSAYTKDAVGLKAAVDAVMTSKVQAAIADLTQDVSASLFGASTGADEVEESEQELVDSSDQETQEDSSQEENSDEAL